MGRVKGHDRPVHRTWGALFGCDDGKWDRGEQAGNCRGAKVCAPPGGVRRSPIRSLGPGPPAVNPPLTLVRWWNPGEQHVNPIPRSGKRPSTSAAGPNRSNDVVGQGGDGPPAPARPTVAPRRHSGSAAVQMGNTGRRWWAGCWSRVRTSAVALPVKGHSGAGVRPRR